MRGGLYLFIRQALGTGIGFVGVLLLGRLIGPASYGLYAASLAIYTYVFSLSQLGIGVYLVRREGTIQEEDFDQAFTLVVGLGVTVAGLVFYGLPFLLRWIRLEGFAPLAAALFAALPLHLATLVPMAKLERALDYRRVALSELIGQVVYYTLALPLAYWGFGARAPVVGWWAQQTVSLVLLYSLAGYRPRFHWDSSRIRQMVGYGLGYSASIWVWQLRGLVNPLVVGRSAGANAVGHVALAIRLVEALSFVKGTAWRISIAALAKIQSDRKKIIEAVSQGMELQVLGLGPIFLAFALVGSWLVPALFGHRWGPAIQIFPFIAISYLVNALFSMHSSALYVLRENWQVTVFHVVHIALFARTALLLTGRLGMEGYGWAEIVALVSYWVIHVKMIRNVGRPNYKTVAVLASGFGVALFSTRIGWPAALGLLLLVGERDTRWLWVRYWRMFQGVRHGSAVG